MPQKQDHLSVSLEFARILIRYASDHGHDGAAIWRKAGLNPGLLQNGEARLSADRFNELWRAVEYETNDDHFGLRLGKAVKEYAGGHLLYAILMNSPTVEAALGKFCRYHCIMTNVVQPRLIDTDNSPKLILETSHPKLMLGLGQEACVFSLFASITESLTGSRGNISEVRFSHPPPKDVDLYRSTFACPTIFQSRSSVLILLKSAMDKPVFLANPELLSKLEVLALNHVKRFSIENTARHRVALVLTRLLANGDKPSVGAVAKTLAMSTRLLQQKLKGEKTAYREILDEVRKATAIRLLQDGQNTISDITFFLGFYEQSSFTHAFQLWTGTTPGQYRKEIAGKSRNRS